MNEKVEVILKEVGKVIRGKDKAIELVMTAMLAKGHILVEDVPGVGKTTLAVAFSRAMELTERRLQFTPDVLPRDVVGFNMIGADGEFQYKPGAILCNLLLADEINRTSTKTQSALLEVMEEGQVTVDGVTRQLPNPFIVIATQNPVGSAGTQMLPESQLDRFMIRISMGYPTMEEEMRLIKERQDINPLDYIQEIISYKKATGIPILQPEQEKKQTDALKNKLGDNEFEEEILDIFKYIMKNSRRIQAKSLFDYNIFLIGFMGAGKSTIAGELKDKLEMDRVEMDQMIVEKQGMSISEIFDEYGEAYFRNLESNTLIELQKRKQTIVSCGGGVVMREENTDHMKKNGRVVLLTAKPETIYERVKDSDERPILNNNMNVEFISGLMDKRKDRYEAVADITVATDGKNVTQICEEIISKLIALDNAKEAEA